MTKRKRLRRKYSPKKEHRLKIPVFIRVSKKGKTKPKKGELELKKRHIWSIKHNGKSMFGFYGKASYEDIPLVSRDPPYIRLFLPEKDALYVRIDWKKRKVYELLSGEYIGKIPKKLELEKYVPVNILAKDRPRTLMEEGLKKFKEEAKEAKKKREFKKILKELKIEQIKTKTLEERIKEGTFP